MMHQDNATTLWRIKEMLYCTRKISTADIGWPEYKIEEIIYTSSQKLEKTLDMFMVGPSIYGTLGMILSQ